MNSILEIWNIKPIRYGFIAVALVLTIYLLGKSAGKKKGREEVDQKPLPNNGQGIPTGWDPKPLANEVFQQLDGWTTWAANKEETFVKLETLTSDQLVAVYNAFNKLFGPKGKGTMTDWLRDELNVSIGGRRDGLVTKLISLNCL